MHTRLWHTNAPRSALFPSAHTGRGNIATALKVDLHEAALHRVAIGRENGGLPSLGAGEQILGSLPDVLNLGITLLVGHQDLHVLHLTAKVVDFAAGRRPGRFPGQALLLDLHELLRPAIVGALDNPSRRSGGLALTTDQCGAGNFLSAPLLTLGRFYWF